MIPAEVLIDVRLSGRDIRVYGILALSRRGSFASIGRVRLAKLAHADRRGVRASVKVLVKCGYIEETKEGKRRAGFTLLSPWFKGKEAPVVVPVGSGQIKVKRQPVSCPKCSKMVPSLLRAGWCRSCGCRMRIVQIVDERIDAVMKTA